MIDSVEYKKEQISQELEESEREIREKAQELGLKPREVNYWIVDQDEINGIAAYGGFQERYPHWRWGMKYDRQRKQSQYGGGKIFELVNNDIPCHAFLQMSNSIADQKSVIAHVEAHSDFFENNKWFNNVDASAMLSRHAEKIREYMEDPSINREDVEEWIDHITCLEDNIDQHSDFVFREDDSIEEEENSDGEIELDVSPRIKRMVFDDDRGKELKAIEENPYIEDREKDILAYLIKNGKQFNEDTQRSDEFERWQIDILDMLREEAYYLAPQKMTKIMNEGWASYWESMMMASEGMASEDEILTFADHQSRVLNSPGFNPYRLGKALWEYIENDVNRREVVDKLLRVEGITPDNFRDVVDFQEVHELLDESDSDDIVERNYSLTRTHNQGFLQEIPLEKLQKCNRYIIESDRYSSVEEAVADVDYSRGWDRMLEIRETHNDIMFIDEFLTQEFVKAEKFFTYEYRVAHERTEIASRDVDDVRKKLLLRFTNFGKPTMEVATGNFDNAGELLLLHQYNGIILDMKQAKDTLERLFEMWGRPVNVATIYKTITEEEINHAMRRNEEPEPEEVPVRIRYDGKDFEEHELDERIADKIRADDVDYNTKPDEWL